MRIGIDCRTIYDVATNSGAGVERYVFYLVKHLLKNDQHNEYVLFFDVNTSQETVDALLKIKPFKVIWYKNWWPFVSSHFLFSFILWGEWLDRMIFPANAMPSFYVGRSLLVVHDVVIYNHPEWFPNKQWFSKMILVPSSVYKATDIVTVSETTKRDLLDLFKFRDKDSIHVVYPGLMENKPVGDLAIGEVKGKFGLPENYLFFTGTIEPRKNLINLFKGFARYCELNQDITTVLAVSGAKGWKCRLIFHKLKTINKRLGREAIIYLGKISDKERQILMTHAKGFTFPSRYEGFGFPILEAMSCGTPVLTSNISAMEEYIKNKEAILVSPENVVEISSGIKKILVDPEFCENMANRANQLWPKFNWDKTSEEILKLI